MLLFASLALLLPVAAAAAGFLPSSARWPRAPAPAPALAAAGRGAWPPLPMRLSHAADSWQVLSNTYLSEGADITNGSMTVAEAEAQCGALPACKGFTYDGAGGPGPAFDMYLKSSVSAGAGTGWFAYVKEVPRVLTGSFSSSGVLQHDAPCLSGYGANVTGAAVSVTTDADGNAAHSTAVQADNTWRLCLPAMTPGGPWTISVNVSGFGAEVLTDMLFGEVWLSSGQSNMAFTVAQSHNASAECAAASSFPNLRVMSVTQGGSPTPQPDFGPYGIRLPWSRASAQTVCGGDFDYLSAVGYFFARDLHLALGIPVGLIVSSVPGTAIEAWSSPEVLQACTDRADSTLWNNMVVPLLGVSIRGATWYQGEANEADPSYNCTFPGMIRDWRKQWQAAPSPGGLGFPFIFAQLSPYMDQAPLSCLAEGGPGVPAYAGTLPRARLRQLYAFGEPNVGMASTIDLADHASPFWPGSIHPRWKQPVGYRMHLEARRIAYGEGALLSRGPQVATVTAFNACELDYSCGSYHQKDAVVFRFAFLSVGAGLSVATFASVQLLSSWANSTAVPPVACRVPCSIVPTSVTTSTLDLYCTAENYCVSVQPEGPLDLLFFDLPVVAVFNSAGLPMEPWSANVTTAGAWPLPAGGKQVWPAS